MVPTVNLGAKDMQRSSAGDGEQDNLDPQLTRLEQGGSGYELHLIPFLSANLAASVLGRDLASNRLRRGSAVFQSILIEIVKHSKNIL